MSLLSERKAAGPLPRLDGKQVLTAANPEIAKVKGVIFASRKQFLTEMNALDALNVDI